MPHFRLSVAKAHEKALAAALVTMHTPFVEFNSDDKRAWVILDCPWPMSLKYRLALHEAIGQEVVWDSAATMPVVISINGTTLSLIQAAAFVSVLEVYAKRLHTAARDVTQPRDVRDNAADVLHHLRPICSLSGITLE